MAIKVAELETAFTGNTRDLDRAFSHSEQRARTFAGKMNQTLSRIGGGGAGGGGLFSSIAGGLQLIPGIGQLAGALGAVTGKIKEGIQFGFDYNRIIEENTIAFEVMLRGADKANSLLRDMARFAETSPFEFPEIISSTKRMLAMGFAVKEIIPTLRAVSDASSALGSDMDGIILALGQMRQKGKVSAEEISQLVERGIPAWEILAKAIGKTVAETQKLGQRGQLSGVGAAQAIAIGMQERFGGLGQRVATETATGLEANLNDVAQRLAGTASGPFFEQYKKLLRGTLEVANSETAASLARGAAGVGGGTLDVLNSAIKTGADIGGGLIQGVGAKGFDAARTFIDEFRTGIGAKSPAQEFIPIGEDAARGFQIGFSNVMGPGGVMGLFQVSGGRRGKYEAAAKDPKVRAFFEAIRQAEGGRPDIMAGGRRVSDLSRHPGEYIPKSQWFSGPEGKSSAAGNWQITRTNWRQLAPMLGLLNFGVENQLLAAIAILDRAGGLDLLLAGDIRGAMKRATDWAAVPSSHLKGRKVSESSFLGSYGAALGQTGGGRPAGMSYEEQIAYVARLTGMSAGKIRDLTTPTDTPGYGVGVFNRGGGVNVEEMIGTGELMRGEFGDSGPTVGRLAQEIEQIDLGVTKLTSVTMKPLQELPGIFTSAANEAQGFNDKILQTEPILMKAQESAKFLGLEVEGIKQGFEDAFINAFGNIDQGFKGMLSSFAIGFAQTLQQMAAQAAASQLSGVLGKIIGIGLGALSGGFGGAAKATTGAGLAGGLAAGFGGSRAAGGDVRAGWLYQTHGLSTGEEVFVPNQSGRIYNQQQMGQPVSIVVNVPVRPSGSYSSPMARREVGDAIAAALQSAFPRGAL